MPAADAPPPSLPPAYDDQPFTSGSALASSSSSSSAPPLVWTAPDDEVGPSEAAFASSSAGPTLAWTGPDEPGPSTSTSIQTVEIEDWDHDGYGTPDTVQLLESSNPSGFQGGLDLRGLDLHGLDPQRRSSLNLHRRGGLDLPRRASLDLFRPSDHRQLSTSFQGCNQGQQEHLVPPPIRIPSVLRQSHEQPPKWRRHTHRDVTYTHWQERMDNEEARNHDWLEREEAMYHIGQLRYKDIDPFDDTPGPGEGEAYDHVNTAPPLVDESISTPAELHPKQRLRFPNTRAPGMAQSPSDEGTESTGSSTIKASRYANSVTTTGTSRNPSPSGADRRSSRPSTSSNLGQSQSSSSDKSSTSDHGGGSRSTSPEDSSSAQKGTTAATHRRSISVRSGHLLISPSRLSAPTVTISAPPSEGAIQGTRSPVTRRLDQDADYTVRDTSTPEGDANVDGDEDTTPTEILLAERYRHLDVLEDGTSRARDQPHAPVQQADGSKAVDESPPGAEFFSPSSSEESPPGAGFFPSSSDEEEASSSHDGSSSSSPTTRVTSPATSTQGRPLNSPTQEETSPEDVKTMSEKAKGKQRAVDDDQDNVPVIWRARR